MSDAGKIEGKSGAVYLLRILLHKKDIQVSQVHYVMDVNGLQCAVR